MVRPELPPGEGRTERINVRATPAIRDKSKEMAAAVGISVADLIERFLFHLTDANMPPPLPPEPPKRAEKVKTPKKAIKATTAATSEKQPNAAPKTGPKPRKPKAG